ncbi:hypothetical protein [Streptomyces sp. NPDC001340]
MTEQAQAQLPTPEPSPPVGDSPAPSSGKDRRVLRAALRWTAAVAVFAVVGAGTAFGITRIDRTDVPGLATASDGRWEYPELVRPPVPAGSPGPLSDANRTGTHYADLRALLLPASKGATEEQALRGHGGWLTTQDFVTRYAVKDDRRELGQKLTDYGLRHVAARGWTSQDGTHTRIYLLQFDTAAVADQLMTQELTGLTGPTYAERGADAYVLDEKFPSAAQIDGVTLMPYTETEPYGAEQVRLAYLAAGDTIAVITQSRKGGVNAVPFRQTVTLQTELLT